MNVSAQNYAYVLGRQLRMQTALASVLTAADGEDNDNDLLVMNTGDGARLLMEVYTDYVSEYDFSNFMKFMREVDRVLYRARGNKAFTHEERRAMENAEPAPTASRKKRKKTRTAPAPVVTPVPPPSVTAMAQALSHHLAA